MLYVIRHASAEDARGGADVDRKLSVRGREEARRAGRALAKIGLPPELILCSPAARATETAELIAEQLNPMPPVEQRDLLYGGPGPASQLKLVRSYAAQRLALVGHLPDVGQLVATVAGADVSFRPSSVCCLELSGGRGRLIWFKTPDELASLAQDC